MRTPLQVLLAECVGTAVLLAVGLSCVILDFGTGSPVLHWLPDPWTRRLLTGLLFGSTGGLIATSWVGRVSGAHINPAVSLAFWWRGTFDGRHVAGYIGAQLLGGALGSLPLLLWGRIGASVDYGATVPGAWGTWGALAGEALTTFALVVGLLLFTGHRSLRRFTPLLMPALYAIMVTLEAPISGTSTNPARSLGPALVAWQWHAFWVYLVGPLIGAALAVLTFRLRLLSRFESEVAKLYHFEVDLHGIFRRPM
ncbi:MAG: aquaporin family protein [Deinococcales bacterium]